MKKNTTFLLSLVLPFVVFSNAIAISNLTTNYNSTSGVCKAVFDLSWKNSWRTNAISNWDAAWMFFKYKEAGVWKHLDLTGYNMTLPSEFTYTVPCDKKGIYIYRDAVGTGNVSMTGCEVGLVPKMGTYDIKAFGIEMVYIPQGAFYVGDGSSYATYRTGTTNNPFYINNPYGGNVGMGNSNATQLYDSLGNGTLAATFPKRYDNFYCMRKYSIKKHASR